MELQRLLVGLGEGLAELLALPEVQRKLVSVSADATPTRLGAVDWTARVAIACEADQTADDLTRLEPTKL